MTIALALLKFIKSPIGKYVAIGILVAGLFIGLRAHFIHQGQTKGKQEASAQYSEQLKQQQEQDRKAAADHIAEDNKKDQVINQQLLQSAAALQSSNQALAILAKARQDSMNQVAALKDGELHPFIVKTLNLRPANDSTPGYEPAEERAIATAVVDDPVCRKTSAETDKKVQALSDQVTQLTNKVQVNEDKFNTLATYTTNLERTYTTLYNAFPRQGPRLWWTLGLVHGKPKQIPTPDPKSLLKEVK